MSEAHSQVTASAVSDADLYSNFINSLKSKSTKESYDYALKRFMGFHLMEVVKYSSLMVEGKEAKEQLIKSYIVYLVGKNTSTSRINTTMCAITHLSGPTSDI